MASSSDTAHTLLDILATRGEGDYIGEPISQLQHSLQAAHLAKHNNADEETVVAALLHDIGQFLPADEVTTLAHEVRDMQSADADESVGRVGHERIGEAYLLRLGFPSKVAGLVGSHVEAKRFLCAIEPGYEDALSEASKASFRFQGGAMSEVEVEEWKTGEWWREMCELRKWDDGAKVVGLEVDGVEGYRGIVERCLERAAAVG